MGLVGPYGLALHMLTCPELPLTSRVPTSTSLGGGRLAENGRVKRKLAKSGFSCVPNMSCIPQWPRPQDRRKLLCPGAFLQPVLSETTWQVHHELHCRNIFCHWLAKAVLSTYSYRYETSIKAAPLP